MGYGLVERFPLFGENPMVESEVAVPEQANKLLLECPVLVLNRLWQPIHTCSVKRAIRLVCLGHAQIVQTDGDAQYQTHDLISWAKHSSGPVWRVNKNRASCFPRPKNYRTGAL